MRMATLSRLRSFLHRRLDLDRTGGVLFHRDAHTLILADKDVLASAHLRQIEAMFPHVTSTFMSCDTSVSGYIVVFSCALDCGTAWQRSAVRLLLHALCFLGACWWAS